MFNYYFIFDYVKNHAFAFYFTIFAVLLIIVITIILVNKALKETK